MEAQEARAPLSQHQVRLLTRSTVKNVKLLAVFSLLFFLLKLSAVISHSINPESALVLKGFFIGDKHNNISFIVAVSIALTKSSLIDIYNEVFDHFSSSSSACLRCKHRFVYIERNFNTTALKPTDKYSPVWKECTASKLQYLKWNYTANLWFNNM